MLSTIQITQYFVQYSYYCNGSDRLSVVAVSILTTSKLGAHHALVDFTITMTSVEKYIAAFQAANSIKKISFSTTFHNAPTRNTEMAWRPSSTSKKHHIGSILNFSPRCNNALDTRHAAIYSLNLSVLQSANREDNDQYEDQTKNSHKGNPPSKKRQKRRRDLFIINKDTNVVMNLLELLVSFLFQRFSLPSILNILPGRLRSQEKVEVPLVYILSILISAVISPLITWGLFTGFFGVYLALGTAFMEEFDDLGRDFDPKKNGNDDFDIEREEGEYNGVVPLAAFTGALASAALLSPQGFVSPNASLSLVTPVAIITVLLGGLAILMGIRNINEDVSRWEERDTRERMVQNEMRQMKFWDGEIEKSIGKRKNKNDN
ncbi:hypothetical protein ACHAW6_014849 [Cyclotella cf. meneghiniana]